MTAPVTEVLEHDDAANQYSHQATAEMSSFGIRLKCKIQGFDKETVTRELVKLYCEIEEQFKAKGYVMAPVQLKNGVTKS
jgi:hypothetical protein